MRGHLAHPSRYVGRYARDGFAFDSAGLGPHEVDVERLVEMRVVGAIVAAACLAAYQGRLEPTTDYGSLTTDYQGFASASQQGV